MNILGCLDRPTSGAYYLDGISVGELNRNELAEIRNKKIGFVFQQFNLLPRTSAIKNVQLPLLYSDSDSNDAQARAMNALSVVGLADRADHRPNQLSGGQQQRVAIARSLINDPAIILADEPTGALDSRTSIEIMAIFQRLNREHGITVVIVTHEPDISCFAERILSFKDGRLVRDEPVKEQRQATRELQLPESEMVSSMKKLVHSLTIAFDALRINKMRSALTMLGIIIGVAAVIAMVAVGSGAEERIRQQIASIGSNVIVVLSGSLTSSGIRMGTGNAQTLTEEDARAIIRECDAVALATPAVRGGVQSVYGNSNWGTQVMGTTPDYLPIRDIEIDEGQPFTSADVDSTASVALLGKTVADNLFYGEDPVGKIIRIKTVSFTVIGTLVPKGQSPSGQDQDDVILMPITTAKKRVIGVSQANYARRRFDHGTGQGGPDPGRPRSDCRSSEAAPPSAVERR